MQPDLTAGQGLRPLGQTHEGADAGKEAEKSMPRTSPHPPPPCQSQTSSQELASPFSSPPDTRPTATTREQSFRGLTFCQLHTTSQGPSQERFLDKI